VRMVKAGRFARLSIDPPAAAWLPTVTSIVLLIITGYRALAYQFEPILTLRAQEQQLQPVANMLDNSDTIYVHGSTEILVLLNKPNLNPFVLLDWGKDDFIAAERYGGSFDAVVEEIEARAPKIVALGRLQRVSHREALRRWVEQHYEDLDLPGYSVYVRKDRGTR